MIRVFLADDHPIVREGLKRILSEKEDITVVGEAANGTEVLKGVSGGEVDVLLLDLSLPGRNGMDILKQLRAVKPHLPILILSIHPEDQYALRVLKAGAAGYVTKESAPDTLIRAIRKVYAGGRYVSEELAERLTFFLNTDLSKDPHEALSDREFQIFLMIAEGKRLSEIADDLNLSIKTISTYRTRLLEKMRLSSNAEIIRYALHARLID